MGFYLVTALFLPSGVIAGELGVGVGVWGVKGRGEWSRGATVGFGSGVFVLD